MNKKKVLGQFFTRPEIASFMGKLIFSEKTNSVLDPALGTGIFLKTANNYCKNASKDAYEIDDDMVKIFLNQNISHTHLYQKDYLTASEKKLYDAIICNPPYHKFQEIKNRKQLINTFSDRYGIHLSGYSNLCVYFLIKSMNELNIGGKCCYIMPYEFLNTGYGAVIKKYLLDSGKLHSIIKFDNNIALFNDATTTSCILYIENIPHKSVKFINITDLDDLTIEKYSENSIEYQNTELDFKAKWLPLFSPNECKNKYKNLITLSSYAVVKRGIATGNNKYFILNEEKIKKYGLSRSVCMPCVTKSLDIKKIILDKDEFVHLTKENKGMYIFDGEKVSSENDKKYIEYGENIGCNLSYLTSHRSPWYAVEKKKIAPIFMGVFNRGNIKIIRNECGVNNLTAFHGLFFKKDNISESEINIFFAYLLTPIAQQILFSNKREYGSGLDKFEPNDFNNAYILNMEIISKADKKRILNLYEQIKVSQDCSKIIEQLNNIFKFYSINL